MTEHSILVSIPAGTLRALFAGAGEVEKFHLEIRVDRPTPTPQPWEENSLYAGAQSPAPVGKYELRVEGQIYPEQSLKNALVRVFREFNALDENFLDAFEKCGTLSRSYIARDTNRLYLRSSHLRLYAVEFLPGWWMGSNISFGQAVSIIEAARKCLKALSGADFIVTLKHK